MKTFEELGLSKEVLGTLSNLRIKIPSEIQEKTIPLVLAGRDVIGGSSTGSGKTLAFASGMVENLQKNGKVQALILTPTRELAEQVADSIKKFSEYKKLKVLPVYGGINIDIQIREIKNTDIVVGTPGRILDHMRRNTLNLSNVKFLVLDEVDRMFDMGFLPDVEMILEECPKERQTMLFSATISLDMDYLARKYTREPTEVSVKSHIDPSKLKQVYYDVADGLKFSLFVHLLKKEKSKLVMVFCGTRRNVDFVVNNLNNLGIKARAIHGGMMQNKRNQVLNEFNSKKDMNVLVCTDVAARGLDISEVSHVYNYDLSKTSVEYIHRVGRTARAGREGIAISVLCSKDYENFTNILRDEKLKIEKVKTPWVEKIKIIVDDKRSFGRRGGNRRNFRRGKSKRY
jgi:ATP-dependent RNA helicase DeaD